MSRGLVKGTTRQPVQDRSKTSTLGRKGRHLKEHHPHLPGGLLEVWRLGLLGGSVSFDVAAYSQDNDEAGTIYLVRSSPSPPAYPLPSILSPAPRNFILSGAGESAVPGPDAPCQGVGVGAAHRPWLQPTWERLGWGWGGLSFCNLERLGDG